MAAGKWPLTQFWVVMMQRVPRLLSSCWLILCASFALWSGWFLSCNDLFSLVSVLACTRHVGQRSRKGKCIHGSWFLWESGGFSCVVFASSVAVTLLLWRRGRWCGPIFVLMRGCLVSGFTECAQIVERSHDTHSHKSCMEIPWCWWLNHDQILIEQIKSHTSNI